MPPDSDPRSAREANLVADTSGMLDRAVQQDLQRIRAESLLARQDSAQELTRALDASLAEPLSLNEITSGLDRLEGQALPSFAELESLLAAPEAIGLTLEQNLLAELVKDGVIAQSILSKGLVFLKHRRYPEALEWWTLQRQGLDQTSSRLCAPAPHHGDADSHLVRPPRPSGRRPQPGQSPPPFSADQAGVVTELTAAANTRSTSYPRLYVR